MNDTIKIWKSNLQGLLEEVVGLVSRFGAPGTSNGQIPIQRLCQRGRFQQRRQCLRIARPTAFCSSFAPPERLDSSSAGVIQ